jgi:hypothetical protein
MLNFSYPCSLFAIAMSLCCLASLRIADCCYTLQIQWDNSTTSMTSAWEVDVIDDPPSKKRRVDVAAPSKPPVDVAGPSKPPADVAGPSKPDLAVPPP